MTSRTVLFRFGLKALALALLAAFSVLALGQVHDSWWFQDSAAYWGAAMRLREGEPLYPMLVSQDASSVYRYAPWFAFSWVPLTLLPETLVLAMWTLGMGAAASYCAYVPLRHRSAAGVALALVAVAMLLPAAASGNVQPLIVAALLWGADRQSGPVWIAAAASLKAAPILLIAVFLGRRQWWRAAITIAVTALLVVPMLLFDLDHYPMAAGAATGPIATAPALAIAAGLTALAVGLARTPYGWLAGAAAVMLAIVRWSYYQPSLLLIGLASRRSPE
ncbi:MAG: glycosyltransferase 87 family protein [Chloroflexota bacterium]